TAAGPRLPDPWAHRVRRCSAAIVQRGDQVVVAGADQAPQVGHEQQRLRRPAEYGPPGDLLAEGDLAAGHSPDGPFTGVAHRTQVRVDAQREVEELFRSAGGAGLEREGAGHRLSVGRGMVALARVGTAVGNVTAGHQETFSLVGYVLVTMTNPTVATPAPPEAAPATKGARLRAMDSLRLLAAL